MDFSTSVAKLFATHLCREFSLSSRLDGFRHRCARRYHVDQAFAAANALQQFQIDLFESLRLLLEVEVISNGICARARNARNKTGIFRLIEQRSR